MKSMHSRACILSVVLALLFISAKLPSRKVPVAVKTAFQKEYPDVKKVKWEKEGKNFEAEFEKDEIDISVVIDAAGNIVETEKELDPSLVPVQILDYIFKTYPGAKILESAEIYDNTGLVMYEVKIKKAEMLFDSQGNFIRNEKD